jgi:hypothetical protein
MTDETKSCHDCGAPLALTTAEPIPVGGTDLRPTGDEVPVWSCSGCEFIEEAE